MGNEPRIRGRQRGGGKIHDAQEIEMIDDLATRET